MPHHKFYIGNKYFLFLSDELKAFVINKILYDDIAYKSVDPDDKGFLNYTDSIIRTENIIPVEKNIIKEGNKTENVYTLSLNVAQICNMNCVYCYGNGGEYGNKITMERKTAVRCVDFLVENSGGKHNISICFFGGEPLLNYPLIKEIVDYAKSIQKKSNKRIFFSITTNGTLLNDNINAFLKDNHISVTISFDGNKESQDVNRPLNIPISSFDYIAPRIQHYLAYYNDKATARVTLTGYSSKIRELKSILRKLGFKRMEFVPASVGQVSDISISKEQLYDIIYDIQKEAEDLLIKIKNRDTLYISSFTEIIMRLITRQKKKYFCGAGSTYSAVEADGKMYPCHRFVGNNNMYLGDIKDKSRVGNSKFTILAVDENGYCKKCWAKYLCGGGCYYDNYDRNKDLLRPNINNCIVLKRKAELAVYVLSMLSKEERNYLMNSYRTNNMPINKKTNGSAVPNYIKSQ